MVLSDGLTLAKQMEIAERLSIAVEEKLNFLEYWNSVPCEVLNLNLCMCQYGLDCRNPLSLSFCYYIYIDIDINIDWLIIYTQYCK